MRNILSAIVLLTIVSQFSFAGEHVKSSEDGWPQWRGPARSAITTEKGLLAEWPREGPKLLWKVDGVGKGYSSPIISGGTIYITGDHGAELKVIAMSADGKKKWEAVNGNYLITGWQNRLPGRRADGTYYQAPGMSRMLYAGNGKFTYSHDLLNMRHVMELIEESSWQPDERFNLPPASPVRLCAWEP